MDMSASEQLLYCTTRIVADLGNGATSFGTGFFFMLKFDEGEIPIVVTNKHVVKGASSSQILIHVADSDGNPTDENFSINIGESENCWTPHPDPDVDLCAMSIVPAVNFANENGISLFYRCVGRDLIPNDGINDDLSCIEDVIVIGYPNGLWDHVHNMPILRKGTTATPFKVNYLGKEEFLIDFAVFGGSSGSPVFLHQDGFYKSGNAVTLGGSRLMFLGIVYAGHTCTANGDIVATSELPIHTETRVMMNLGIAIKSSKVLDFYSIYSPKS